MKKRDLFEELKEGAKEMKAHQARKRALPTKYVPILAEKVDVKAVRSALGMTQTGLSSLLGISLRTLQEWEQGRRNPTGAARALLVVAARNPDLVRAALAA